MKIIGFETFLANAGLRNYLFIRLTTDTGLTGIGEATLEWQERTVQTIAHEWVEGRVLGRDPFDVEAVVGGMIRDQYQGGSTVMTAISGVEIALWDIIGKATNQPVYRLLGGRCHARIPAYANGWYGGARTPADYAERAQLAVSRGYRALKFDPFGTAWKVLTREDIEAVIDVVAAVREAVGAGIGLMIEFHGRLGAGTAIAMIRRLEPFQPAWCEEPVAPESLDLLAEVKRSAGCPIAAGERLYTQADFYRLTALRAVDVVQMDLAHCGGLLVGKKIAALAAVNDLRVAPHCSIGPVALAACLHFDVFHGRISSSRKPSPNSTYPGATTSSADGIRSRMASSSWARDRASGWSSKSRPSPTIRMSPTPSPASGTAIGRRISRRAVGSGQWAVKDGWVTGIEDPVSRIRVMVVRVFRVALTGDFLGESGEVAYGDIGLPRLDGCPYIRRHFLTDLAPKPGDSTYWSRLYRLEVTPEHIRDVDGLVVVRPWVKRSTFAAGAEDLVVIGRSGAGYDKIDLAACTEHGVAVFNAPMALNHSTASSALLFMLAVNSVAGSGTGRAGGALGPPGDRDGGRDPGSDARHHRPGPQRP